MAPDTTMQRRPRGRDRAHTTPGRPHRVTARFNDDELAAVAAAAVRAGLTAGGFCAEATLAASHGRITSGAR